MDLDCQPLPSQLDRANTGVHLTMHLVDPLSSIIELVGVLWGGGTMLVVECTCVHRMRALHV